MDLGVIGAVALLVIWAIVALVFEGPGWVHLLLTLGVSLLIYRIVARSSTLDGAPTAPKDPPR
ncbi:MAG: hypothetical protein JWL60_1450 [Gemmatimonadetes bacterium]|jgi:hypothetical protein|nr:hypothetical protein [Gemmatimonadota bacterium]